MGSSASGESEEGVDRRFEGTGVQLDLGQEETPLEHGEEGDGQVVGVNAGRENVLALAPAIAKTSSLCSSAGTGRIGMATSPGRTG